MNMSRKFLEKFEWVIRGVVGTLLFAFLWDTSGGALGASLITLPDFFMTLAAMFGSAAWVAGVAACIFAVLALLATGAMLNGDLNPADYLNHMEKAGVDPASQMKFGFSSKAAIVSGVIGAMSGFYFTGIALLLFVAGVQLFNHTFKEEAKKKGLLKQ